MPSEIFVAKAMADALRNTGYKNIESAMSEIVDNSVQANAKNVFVIFKETVAASGRNNISEILFLDDGDGMSAEELGKCLAYGYSTRRNRKGIGRFGVGLPQASMHACPSVDVFSWQDGYDNCKKVFLDVEKVKSEEQKNIQDPTLEKIPSEYNKFLKYKIASLKKDFSFEKSGTAVLWKKCDRVSPKTINSLFGRLIFAFGQKFRYFLHNHLCDIYLIDYGNTSNIKKIEPNDPLLLMEDNFVLGNPDKPGIECHDKKLGFTEPIFEPYMDEATPNYDPETKSIKFPVRYFDSKSNSVKDSFVNIKFSIVRKEFYAKDAISGNPGGSEIGQHVKKLEGISIVRANREIDFGKFDFYDNVNQPQHRWWGCEIQFEPILDEAFGVANNKQHVELRYVDKEDYEVGGANENEEVLPMWLQLYSIVHNTIDAMYAKNKNTRDNARTKPEPPSASPTEEIINSVEGDNPDDSASKRAAQEHSEEEREEKASEVLKEGGVEDPTEDDVRAYLKNIANIRRRSLGRGAALFDYRFDLGTCSIDINTDHVFYNDYLAPIFEEGDTETAVAFELFIASLVKAIDETNLNEQQERQNDYLMAKWSEKLRSYIYAQQNPPSK